MKLSPENIVTLKGYFKDKPVSKAYITRNVLEALRDRSDDVNILVDLESGHHVALTFYKMKIELEDILKQKVDLVSSGGFSKLVLKKSAAEEKLIYAKAG